MQTNSGRTGLYRVGAGIAVLALGLSACSSSGKKGGGAAPATPTTHAASANTVNTADVTGTGEAKWTIEKKIDSWNPATSEGNTFDFGQVFNGVYPNVFISNPDYTVTPNSDLMESVTQTQADPLQITYKIKSTAKWSDGVPISADDFKFQWDAQNGTDSKFDVAGTTGYQNIDSVVGSDGGKTVVVTFKKDQAFGDYKALFYPLLPQHLISTAGTFTGAPNDDKDFTAEERLWNVTLQNSAPKVSGGPFKIDSVSADGLTTIESRNDAYYGKKAGLDKVTFVSIEDASTEPTALKNGEVDGIYPQPQPALVNQLKDLDPKQYSVNLDAGLQFEHLDFNFHNKALGNTTWGKALRSAMFEATDRKAIIAKTVGQFYKAAAPMNNRFLVPSQAGYQDTTTADDLGNGNVDKAKAALTAAGFKGVGTKLVAPDGTEIPPLQLKYKGNQLRTDTCNEFARQMAQLGVTVNVTMSDSLGKLISQKGDQYQWDVILFAWVGSPFVSGNVSNYQSLPADAKDPGNNDGWYSNKDVDALLAKASAEPDYNKAVALYNQADKLISDDAYTLPLYQKPTLLAFNTKLGNVRDNTTQWGPSYNVGEWGIKKAS